MSQLSIHTERSAFRPGEQLTGQVSWQLDEPVEAIELRLFWYTIGKGATDVQIVQTSRFDSPGTLRQHAFSFTLPEGPYSFSGRLVSLLWALELVVLPKGPTERLELTISPTGEGVDLSRGSLAVAQP